MPMRSDVSVGVSEGGRKLPRAFYDRPTLDVARDLLGKVLVHRRGPSISSGVIVEVEAYIGESDPACHAAPGRTRRNEPLYGPPGHAYVYLNYGLHCLVNVVTEREGLPAAVLIRALDPLDGVQVMRRRRARPAKGRRAPGRVRPDSTLCRGPGNLTTAMGITLAENRLDLEGRPSLRGGSRRETLVRLPGGRESASVGTRPAVEGLGYGSSCRVGPRDQKSLNT